MLTGFNKFGAALFAGFFSVLILIVVFMIWILVLVSANIYTVDTEKSPIFWIGDFLLAIALGVIIYKWRCRKLKDRYLILST